MKLTMPVRSLLRRGNREEQAFGATDKRIATLVEAKEFIGCAANADAHGFFDSADGLVGFPKPQRARSAKVDAVVPAVDLESGGEPSWPAGEIVKSSGLPVALHDLNAFKWFDGPDQDRRGDSRRLAHDIEHEVRAVVKENVCVTGREVHRADARSRPTEVMTCGIAGWIGFCFHDPAAEAAFW